MYFLKDIVLINLLTFYRHKMRIIIFLCLITALSVAAGVMGNYFLSRFVPQISMAIVDLDNSVETNLILSAITEESAYLDLIDFIITPDASGLDVTAVVTFPAGFGASILDGDNLSFIVEYNANQPLASALVQIVAQSFADMLTASQTGVYIALNYATHVETSRTLFDDIFWEINLRFLGLVMSRNVLFDQVFVSLTGGIPITIAYFISMYIALMMCASMIFTDSIRKNFTQTNITSLDLKGISFLQIFIGCALSYFLLFLGINLLFLPFFGMDLLIGVIVISIVLACFASSITFTFKTNIGAGFFVSIFSIISLALSGGIVPIQFFSDNLRFLAYGTFNFWVANLFRSLLTNSNFTIYLLMSMVFAIVFSAIGLLYNKGA